MIIRAPRIPKKFQDHIFSCFVNDTTAKQCVNLAGRRDQSGNQTGRWKIDKDRAYVINRSCVNHYYRHYRELISAATDRAPRLDGEIEIDIGFFGGRAAKYTSEELRRIGKLPPSRRIAAFKKLKRVQKKAQPVLGFLRRHGDIYLLPIRSKSRVQLESAVRLVIVRGSIVYSDAEKGLANISLDGYAHRVINKSEGKYSLGEGLHINSIENVWTELRRSMGKNFRGIPRSTLLLHLKEREYRRNHPHDFATALRSLCTRASDASPRSRIPRKK